MAFKLKIVESWFSGEYVEFKYTKNGIFWKKIYNCEPPFYSKSYTWEPLHCRLGNGNFDKEREKFSTYKKIKEFEEQEWRKYIEKNESIKKEIEEIKQKRLNALKRANS